jgi:hypothetical protein
MTSLDNHQTLSTDELCRSPEWFPADVDVAARRIQFLHLDPQSLERAPFLDNRLDVDWRAGHMCSYDAVELPPATRPAAWLWHTSFCGSTLLARMLHVAPHAVALKEPLVLRRLGDAAHEGSRIDEPLRILLPLLSRPWHAEGRVLIKPTHAALNIARAVMACDDRSRGIVLTSALEDFLISNVKKPPATLSKVPQLVERAMGATRLLKKLGPAAFEPPSTLAVVALQWAAQRELVGELLEAMGPERLRIIDWADLQDDITTSTLECARWLDLGIPEAALRDSVAINATRHSKETEQHFDVATRRSEASRLAETFEPQIREAMAWAERHLLPAMSAGAIAGSGR